MHHSQANDGSISIRALVRRRRIGFVVVSALAMTGCMQKTVTLNTAPEGADLSVVRVVNGSAAGAVPLPQPQSPVVVKLSFDKGVTYQVSAHKPQFQPNQTTVSYDPQSQTDYTVPLTQYEQDAPAVTFGPTDSGVRHLVPRMVPEIGFLIPDTEPDTNPSITPPVKIDLLQSNNVEVDYPWLATSPSADVLVFQRAERQSDGSWTSRIYRVSTRGGSPVLLTNSSAQEYTPTFSYNGGDVIFSSDNVSENATLWRTKADGSSTLLTSLTRSDALDYAPSAGQQLLAYTSVPPRASGPQVWISHIDGTQAGYITAGWSPQISPDGRKLVFLRHGKDRHVQLWRVDSDGSNLTQLTNNQGYDVADPRWSPDGNWIAFGSYEAVNADGARNSDIWVMAADGSKKIRLTQNGSFDGCPAWDRNGHTIYFRSNRGGAWNLWRTDVRPGVIDGGSNP